MPKKSRAHSKRAANIAIGRDAKRARRTEISAPGQHMRTAPFTPSFPGMMESSVDLMDVKEEFEIDVKEVDVKEEPIDSQVLPSQGPFPSGVDRVSGADTGGHQLLDPPEDPLQVKKEPLHDQPQATPAASTQHTSGTRRRRKKPCWAKDYVAELPSETVVSASMTSHRANTRPVLKAANKSTPQLKRSYSDLQRPSDVIDWTTEVTRDLMKKVRSRHALWDVRHPHYAKKNLKQSLWSDVCRELQAEHPEAAKHLTTDEVLGRFAYLRDNFQRILQKIHNTPSGSGGRLKSKWEYFKACSFLLAVDDNTSLESSLELSPQEEVLHEDIIQADFSPRSIGRSPANEKRHYRKGKKLNKYTVEEKDKVLQLLEKGHRVSEIQKLTGIPQSTISTLKSKKDEVKKSVTLAKKLFRGNTLGQRRITYIYSESNRLVAETEYYLLRWIQRRASVNVPQLRQQARIFYQAVCKKRQVKNPSPFNASIGWLHKFKKRCGTKYAQYQGEISSADRETSANYPAIAKQIIEEGGYCKDQIYNADETGLYWKRSPRATFISKNEKQAAGVKVSKERFSLLFACNSSGSHKMKPLVIHKYKRPRPYRHTDTQQGNVYWETTASAYMTSALSVEWFDKYFVPDAKKKCEELNLDFKILLFLDTAPGHAKFLIGRHPCVQVVFLPPNTTSKLQPLEQEIIANVKLLYYKYLHGKMHHETDSNDEPVEIENCRSESDCELPATSSQATTTQDPAKIETTSKEATHATTQETTKLEDISSKEAIMMRQFWNCYNIQNAMDCMLKAWNNISVATIRHAWENLLAENTPVSSDSLQIQRQTDLLPDNVTSITAVPAPGFCDVKDNGVTRELTEEKVDASEAVENLINEDITEDEPEQPATMLEPPSLSVQQLSEALGLLAKARDIVEGKVESETLQEAFDHLNEKMMAMYNSKVNEQKQSTTTKFLKTQQRVAEVIENVTEEEEPIDLNDIDTELPEEPIFVGFDAKIDGTGCSGEKIREAIRRLGSEDGESQ